MPALGLFATVRDLLDQLFASQQQEAQAQESPPGSPTPDADAESETEELPTDEGQTEASDSAEGPAVEPTVEEAGETPADDTGTEATPLPDSRQDIEERIDALREKVARFDAEAGVEAAEPLPEEEITADSLLGQAQQMLSQLADSDALPEEEAALTQEWMHNPPNCDADPAPMVNWSGCDKSEILLDGENMEGAILIGTDFSDAVLIDSDFSGAIMKDADLTGAVLDGVVLRKSELSGADFSGAILLFVDLSYANAPMADFDGAGLYVVLARDSNLKEAVFTETEMIVVDFSHSNLMGADFSGSEIEYGHFVGSNLTNARFNRARVRRSDLSQAALQDADLSRARLGISWLKAATGTPVGSADVRLADVICPNGVLVTGPVDTDVASACAWDTLPPAATVLMTLSPDCNAPAAPGVDWSGCDKSGLNTPGLDLRNANLQGTNFTDASMLLWDLSGADLSGSDLRRATISSTILRGATLDGAYMRRAVIRGSDFDGASMNAATLLQAEIHFSRLREVDLQYAVLDAITVEQSDLSYASLNFVKAMETMFFSVFLRGSDLTGAAMPLVQAFLVNMSEAQIEGLDLTFAQLTDGIWFKGANGTPTSSEDPTLTDTLICPDGGAVFGPLTAPAGELCDWAACQDLIMNGDFFGEDYWDFPLTEYSAVLSDEQALSPDWSARTGIIDPEDNTYSFSSVRQKVTLPAGTDKAVLSFYLYTQTDEPKSYLIPNSIQEAQSLMGAPSAMGPNGSYVGDAQWVIIFDGYGRQLMRPISMRENSQSWELYTVDLSHLVKENRDMMIEVYFGSFNNGHAGVTAMYVDDVSLGNCAGVPRPPRPEPPQPVCADTINNGGFEVMDNAWLLPITPHPAGFSDAQQNSGDYAMRTGIAQLSTVMENGDNVKSFSSALQRVAIPANATAADLSFYLYPQSSEAYNMLIPESIEAVLAPTARHVNYGDAQWVLILDKYGHELARLVSMRSNEQAWREYAFDLLPYKGKTILLYFGTFNNGMGGKTAMFVDDVMLDICTAEVDP